MLIKLGVNEFMDKVAGNEPIPGGGSVSALNSALAAALTAMVAGLTIGKKGYEEHSESMKQIADEANEWLDKAMKDVDLDSEAYKKVFAAFKMPKATEEEKKIRSNAIQEATKFAAEVPMQVAENALKLMNIIEKVAKNGNKNAITDASVAMMCARTGVLGALMNVRINLSSIKDKEYADRLYKRCDEMEIEAVQKEKSLLEFVQQQLSI